MLQKIILWFFILILTSNPLIAGGGWTQEKGDLYLKLSEWWIVADKHYTDQGKIDPNNTIGVFNTSFYTEYGFTKRLTGVAYIPFFSRSTINTIKSATTGSVISQGDAINSFGDTDLGIKYALNTKGLFRTAASLTFGLPLGNSSGGNQNNLQTGDGEFNQILRLDGSSSFNLGGNSSLYTSIGVAFNNRTKGFSDEFRYSFETGFGLMENKNIWLVGKIFGVESFANGTNTSGAMGTSIFANNTEFTSFGFEGSYYLTKKIGLSAGVDSAFRGNLILANPSYSIGIFLDHKKNKS